MPAEPSIQPIVETYRRWVGTLVGYMTHAVELLEGLYAEQDEMIDQLREIFARRHCLRHADFDAILGKVLAHRRRTRVSLPALVETYRAGREAVIQEVQNIFGCDVAQAASAWPAVKQRLLNERDGGAGEVVSALRRVHMEQEELSTALSALLSRGETVRIRDLKTVANRLVGRSPRESAELSAVLSMCESAARNAGLKWQRLAEAPNRNTPQFANRSDRTVPTQP